MWSLRIRENIKTFLNLKVCKVQKASENKLHQRRKIFPDTKPRQYTVKLITFLWIQKKNWEDQSPLQSRRGSAEHTMFADHISHETKEEFRSQNWNKLTSSLKALPQKHGRLHLEPRGFKWTPWTDPKKKKNIYIYIYTLVFFFFFFFVCFDPLK